MKKERTIEIKKLLTNKTALSAILVVVFMIMNSGVYAIQMTPSKDKIIIPPPQNTSVSPMDISPYVTSKGAQPLEPLDDIWDLLFSLDLEWVSGGDHNIGAAFDGTYFYSTRWDESKQHQYDRTGTLVKAFSMGAVLKDLTYDGTYFYSCVDTQIWKMDFINKSVISNIPVSFSARAIAYNDDLDVFYCSDWRDPVWVVNRNGTIVDWFNLKTTLATSGLAYDNVSPGGPYLWVFDQGYGPGYPQYIHQWDLAAGSFTGVKHDVTTDFPLYSVSGGLFFTTDFTGDPTIVGCLQAYPDMMFCYEPPTIPWGYNVGVRKILAPADGPAGVITPKVTVRNYGVNPVTDVPVRMIIDRFIPGTSPVEYMNEGFSSWLPSGWTQSDPFTQSFTTEAGGFCPEAHIGFPEYTGSDWIQSTAVNTTTASALTLSFRTSIDSSSFKNSFYVKTRNNASDPWTDRTPWINPHNTLSTSRYDIDISDDIGPGTQVNFSVTGQTGFMHDWYIDDVLFIQPEGPGSYASEYNETVAVNLSVGETVDVSFPDWTPDGFGVIEGVDIDYRMEAGTLLVDDNPGNDWKSKSITLHFSYFHDMTVVDVQPCVGGPGQAQEVTARVKNIGLNPEGDFLTTVQIGLLQTGASIFSEDFSINTWTQQPPLSNWGKSSTSHAGGVRPEYHFTRTPDSVGALSLVSPPINTTGYTFGILSFKHFVTDCALEYALAVETSVDGGVTWERLWEIPGGSRGPETVEIPLVLDSSTLQIAFVFQGYSKDINCWYVDDIEIVAASFIAEYSEDVYIPPALINPGEEIELVFPDWTPTALASGVSGDITYIVQGQTHLPGDTNPSNNLSASLINLGWWHDVGVQKDLPYGIFYAYDNNPEFIWFTDPEVIHTIGPNTSPYVIAGGTWADINGGAWYVIANDLENSESLLYTVDPDDGTMKFIGHGEPDDPIRDIAYDDTTSTMYGVTSEQLYTVDLTTGATTLVGGLYGMTSVGDIAIDNDGNCYEVVHDFYYYYLWSINLNNGVCNRIGSTGIPVPEGVSSGKTTVEYDKENEILYNINYIDLGYGYGNLFTCNVTTGQLSYVGSFPIDTYILHLAIPYTVQPPPRKPQIYYKPGTHPISANVENLGSFPESNLTISADLYEYISNPNGILIYNDSITDITLDPLGDEETLTFDSYDFTAEGVYGLYLDLPLLTDDKPLNNHVEVFIGIDDTPPASTHTLQPSTPTGLNNWYIDSIVVTLTGEDGTELFQSGINRIDYQINNGSIQSVTSGGTFTLSTDGYYTVEYWAVDNVDNEETNHHTFTVKIDRTPPTIDLIWERVGLISRDILFTAVCSDSISGIDYVEFYKNGLYKSTASAYPYEWTMIWVGNSNNYTVTAIAFNNAGLNASDSLESVDSFALSGNSATPNNIVSPLYNPRFNCIPGSFG
jgi:hypothetical protein